jgi:hypothetical protein
LDSNHHAITPGWSATLKLGTASQNTARLSDNGDSSVLRTFSRPSLTRLPRIL